VVQVYRTRRTQDLSLGMFALLTTGVALWLAYGVLLGSAPIYVANGVTLVLASYILGMKLTESRRST
jgi:MtN3 and saliva related transmembrane protein